jgi:DNA-binding winged helix-turn-helix (wHTH) protein
MAACAISSRSTRSTPTGASCIAGAEVVSVAPQVFDLLDYLIRNRERVVTKDDLINAIWNGRSVSDAALTTRLNAVRTAIGDSGEEQRLIKTLPRKGFRFVGPMLEAGAGMRGSHRQPPETGETRSYAPRQTLDRHSPLHQPEFRSRSGLLR